MVSIKEATEKAVTFARATLGEDRASGLRLEEVESGNAEGEDAWLITLSMFRQGELPTQIYGREYKVFYVLKSSGEVVAMKIRELADA